MNACTRKLFLKSEEVQDTGPSVDSEDIEERIAARRIRIKNRLEQQKPNKEDELDEEAKQKALIGKKQIELSIQRIEKLSHDGNAFISNIRVACDARENLRRIEEDELNRVRRSKLESEAKNALDKFNEIIKKWDIANEKDVPQELQELLNNQKESCTGLIDVKNELINEIYLELKAKDDHYVRELKKRAEDIDILVERMESQISTMQKTYRMELEEIEKAFITQRNTILADQNKEWHLLMQEIRDKQINYLESRRQRQIEFEEELQNLRTKHSEDYNALKIKLEGDVQKLESQLQKMKATYQLNLEKLEYNFQVLKRRDEENMITKSQQKRKITRFQDTLNNLRIKATKMAKNYRLENEQLSEDYKRRMELFRDLQKKSRLLIEAEHRSFRDLWMMNENELKVMAKKLAIGDKIIHEQQLGIAWQEHDVSFMNNIGPLDSRIDNRKKQPLAAFAMALATNNEQSLASKLLNKKVKEKPLPKSLRECPPQIINQFINLLCYEPEFLIEDKMKKLLKPLPEEEQKLMRLDAVLSAFAITTEAELNKLFVHFVVPIPSKITTDLSTDGPTEDLQIRIESIDSIDSIKKEEFIHSQSICEGMLVEHDSQTGVRDNTLSPEQINPANKVRKEMLEQYSFSPPTVKGTLVTTDHQLDNVEPLPVDEKELDNEENFLIENEMDMVANENYIRVGMSSASALSVDNEEVGDKNRTSLQKRLRQSLNATKVDEVDDSDLPQATDSCQPENVVENETNENEASTKNGGLIVAESGWKQGIVASVGVGERTERKSRLVVQRPQRTEATDDERSLSSKGGSKIFPTFPIAQEGSDTQPEKDVSASAWNNRMLVPEFNFMSKVKDENESEDTLPYRLIDPVDVVCVLQHFTQHRHGSSQRTANYNEPRFSIQIGLTQKQASTASSNQESVKICPDDKNSVNNANAKLANEPNKTGSLHNQIPTDEDDQDTLVSDLEERDDSQDAAYWEKYHRLIVSPEKEQLWDSLLLSMDRYWQILRGRSRLIKETDALRNQNAELRHLLQQYMNSKVNYELQIPPARFIQTD